jgi:hypothetical protein
MFGPWDFPAFGRARLDRLGEFSARSAPGRRPLG